MAITAAELEVVLKANTRQLSAGMNSATRSVQTGSAQIGRSTAAVGQNMNRMGATARRAGGMIGAAFKGTLILGAIAGIAKGVHAGWQEAKESTAVHAQLANVLKNTGATIGVTTGHVEKLAEAMMGYSGVDDELIGQSAATIAAFTNIRNGVGATGDIFDRTTKAALDMSVATGKDMTAAAKALATALNNPAKASAKLARQAGITAPELDKVKQAAENGAPIWRQQEMLLGMVEKRYKGAAKAAGETRDGQIAIMKQKGMDKLGEIVNGVANAFWTTAIRIKAAVSEGGALYPIVQGLKTAWAGLKEGVSKAGEAFAKGFGAKSGETGQFFRRVAKSMGEFIAKAGPVAAKWLPKIAYGFGVAARKGVEFAKWAGPKLNAAWNGIKAGWGKLKSVFAVWKRTIQDLTKRYIVMVAQIKAKWAQLKASTSSVWNSIKSIISSVWRVIRSTITGAVNGARARVSAGFNAMRAAVASRMGAVKATVANAWNAVKARASSAMDSVKSTISSKINAWVSLFREAGSRMAEGIRSAIRAINLPDLKISWSSVTKGPVTVPVPNLSWAARGGIFDGAQIIGVGEAGPEAVVPLGNTARNQRDRARVMQEAGLGGGAGGGIVLNVSFPSAFPPSPEQARQVARVILSEFNRAGSARNSLRPAVRRI